MLIKNRLKLFVIKKVFLKHFKTFILIIFRLIVGLDFDSNYWNQFDSTIPTLEIDSKLNLVRANLKSIQFNSSRYSISILEIESNCQEIENNVIMSRVIILRFV